MALAVGVVVLAGMVMSASKRQGCVNQRGRRVFMSILCVGKILPWRVYGEEGLGRRDLGVGLSGR